MKQSIDKFYESKYEGIVYRKFYQNPFAENKRELLKEGAISDYSLSINQFIGRCIEKNANFLKQKEIILRSDAKYFLLHNYWFMIYQPLAGTNSMGRLELRTKIKDDINLLIEALKLHCEKEHLNEISSHLILNAGSKLWNRLSLTSKDSW